MSNLKNSAQKEMNKNKTTPTFDSQKESQNADFMGYVQQDTTNYVNEKIVREDVVDKKKIKKIEKPLKVFGGFCIAVFIAMIIFSYKPAVNKSSEAKEALKNKVSTSLSAGTILLAKDENIGQQNYTITHKSENKETKIWVWDYAAEDGDYVQILVNGTPVSEAFMIKHKPKEIIVPATGDIQIKGIKDGGGGITYAVRYELNGTNYFNSAPEGEYNTYTLVKE